MSPTALRYSREQINAFLQQYREADLDGDGRVSVDELAVLLSTLGHTTDPDYLATLVDQADENHNGQLDFEEFVEVMHRLGEDDARDPSQEEFEAMFTLFDEDGDGSITRSELRMAMALLGQPITDEELEARFQQADEDGSGGIEYSEFLTLLMN